MPTSRIQATATPSIQYCSANFCIKRQSLRCLHTSTLLDNSPLTAASDIITATPISNNHLSNTHTHIASSEMASSTTAPVQTVTLTASDGVDMTIGTCLLSPPPSSLSDPTNSLQTARSPCAPSSLRTCSTISQQRLPLNPSQSPT
jgi:hypothetical protein